MSRGFSHRAPARSIGRPRRVPGPLSLAVIWTLGVVAGCEREGVHSHRVPKGIERVPPADSVDAGADTPIARSPISDRPWALPDGWTEVPEPRQMRVATFIAPDPAGPIEVAVTRFGGRVGGDLANINRWRGQMGLPPLAAAELDSEIVRFSRPGYDGYETRIEAPSGVMLAAGVYDESIDQMWFVRATVPNTDVADRIQPELFEMARSITESGGEGDDG